MKILFLSAFMLTIILLYVLSPQRKYKDFFSRISFMDYRGKLPRYIGSKKVSAHLIKSRFKSRIPKKRWQEIVPEIEQFRNQRIYKVEQPSIREINIFLIIEKLPNSILWNDIFLDKSESKFSVGEGYMGTIVWDAASLPHGVVAGATGGGKTALLRCIVHQAIMKKYNVTVMDFKHGGDFAALEQETQKYRDLESGYGPFLISEPEEASKLLMCLTVEVRGRAQRFKERNVTNIYEYNALGEDHLVPWLVVIDEAAELLDVTPADKATKELYAGINQSLRTLARTSRAAGVHILMGFIRPDSSVIDGQIKNNLLWRVCGYFSDDAASRIVLDNDRATELPPEIKGRFIIGEDEVQAYYLPPIPPTHPPCEIQSSTCAGTAQIDGEAEREPPTAPPAAEGGALT